MPYEAPHERARRRARETERAEIDGLQANQSAFNGITPRSIQDPIEQRRRRGGTSLRDLDWRKVLGLVALVAVLVAVMLLGGQWLIDNPRGTE